MVTKEIHMKGASFSQIRGVVGYSPKFQMKIPENCHPILQKIMSCCLRRNPKDRPSFDEVYTMLQGYHREKEVQKSAKSRLLRILREVFRI
jgi:Protein tyrosine and serine/threonine kinase